MTQRTNLDRQITAVADQRRKTSDLALTEALGTPLKLRKVQEAVYQEPPDQEQVTNLLVELLIGS